MSLALVAIGVLLVATPASVERQLASLHPREAARLVAVTLVGGIAAVEIGLVLLALPTVSRATGTEHLLGLCADATAQLVPGGGVSGWLAAVAAGLLAWGAVSAAAVARRRARRMRVEQWLGHHEHQASVDVVVLPTPEPVAMGVPGSTPQVVVSDGLLQLLDPDEVEAVIAHEVAHHDLRHRRYLVTAAVVERALGVLPRARRSARVLRDVLERWADDSAGRTPAARDALGRALEVLGPQLAVGHVAPRRSVRRRLASLRSRLDTRVRAARWLVYSPVSALVLVASFLVLAWLADAQHAVALGCVD